MGNREKALFAWVTLFFALGILFVSCSSKEDRLEIDLDDVVADSELYELSSHPSDPDVLHFGFDRRASPQEDARQYLPLLDYLQETTGYTFELVFTPKDGRIVDDLGTGEVQFAAIGAGSFLQARAKYGVVPLVRGLNAQGRAEYRSVIVVSPGSSIQSLPDLRGKRMAFGSATSTQGYLIPMIALIQNGLALDDLASYEYTGSHQNCASAVTTGHVDACGMQDTMGQELAAAGLLRIIYTSPYYPSSGIVANKDVPPEILDSVQQALLDFDPQGRDAPGLYHWDQTEMPNGFVKAAVEDYAELLQWAVELGYIDAENGGGP